jgi:hypothetical protein
MHTPRGWVAGAEGEGGAEDDGDVSETVTIRERRARKGIRRSQALARLPI